MSRLRLVLDTNVLVSAFLWRGMPGRPVEPACEREVRLLTSRALLDELAATLAKKKTLQVRRRHRLDDRSNARWFEAPGHHRNGTPTRFACLPRRSTMMPCSLARWPHAPPSSSRVTTICWRSAASRTSPSFPSPGPSDSSPPGADAELNGCLPSTASQRGPRPRYSGDA